MNLKPSTQKYFGQEEFFRNSVGIEHKTSGLTLDGSTLEGVTTNGYVKAGTAVSKGANGLFAPIAEAATADSLVAACLTSHDIKVVTGSNPIVGGVVAGHPLENKCTGVTAAFKEATKGRLVFDV